MITNLGRLGTHAGVFGVLLRCDDMSCREYYRIEIDEFVARTSDEDPRPQHVQAVLDGKKWVTITATDGSMLHYCPEHAP